MAKPHPLKKPHPASRARDRQKRAKRAAQRRAKRKAAHPMTSGCLVALLLLPFHHRRNTSWTI